MIISENKKPPLDDFRLLMKNTDTLLNAEAKGKEAYYSTRNGTQLEQDVFEALRRSALGTPFENTIQLVSGASFPDVVASRFYGVEVKSTNKNHWKSIGSSILESTRNQDVERIFLTFGKLGAPVQFKSRPYEECLSGISVTHNPRYQIDMELSNGETIFDKMGIPYDELRRRDNPVVAVSQYYKSQLREGESLWWAAESNPEESSVPATVRLWTSLSAEQKDYYTAQGIALFPEVFLQGSNKKYQRYALWLATNCGIVDTNIRDQFSAGGKKNIITAAGVFEKMPAVYARVEEHAEWIIRTIMEAPEMVLKEHWNVDCIEENRINQWCKVVARSADNTIGYDDTYILLKSMLNL